MRRTPYSSIRAITDSPPQPALRPRSFRSAQKPARHRGETQARPPPLPRRVPPRRVGQSPAITDALLGVWPQQVAFALPGLANAAAAERVNAAEPTGDRDARRRLRPREQRSRAGAVALR
eukprot:352753-Chlamydomonas_euryale.AAC.4